MADSIYHLSPEEEPSIVIVTAVADVIDESPLELEPLHATVDTEALDGMLETADGTEPDVTVTFEYCGCEVTVTPVEARVGEGE